MKMWLTIVALAAVAAAPSVGGSWTLTVEGGPHGNVTMGLTLTQEGAKVTGTFASGHGPEMPVTGEFVDGALKIQTDADKDGDAIVFTAKLKDDGTLAGYISSPMGDMKWSAQRAGKERR
jgi:hypothetical protein